MMLCKSNLVLDLYGIKFQPIDEYIVWLNQW